MINSGARDELIASGAEMVISYDPATGKELWRANGTQSHPIPSPVATKGLVFLSAGSQAKVVMAMKPGGNGNLKDSKNCRSGATTRAPPTCRHRSRSATICIW